MYYYPTDGDGDLGRGGGTGGLGRGGDGGGFGRGGDGGGFGRGGRGGFVDGGDGVARDGEGGGFGRRGGAAADSFAELTALPDDAAVPPDDVPPPDVMPWPIESIKLWTEVPSSAIISSRAASMTLLTAMMTDATVTLETGAGSGSGGAIFSSGIELKTVPNAYGVIL